MSKNNNLYSFLTALFICPALLILRILSVAEVKKSVGWNSGWIKYCEIPVVMKVIMIIILILAVIFSVIMRSSAGNAKKGKSFIFTIFADIILGFVIIFLSYEIN